MRSFRPDLALGAALCAFVLVAGCGDDDGPSGPPAPRAPRTYRMGFSGMPSRPDFDIGRCPFYLLEVPEGTYYGVPNLPGQGLKAGRHDSGEVTTPETARRSVDVGEVEKLRSVLEHYMPGAAAALKATSTCIYTMTPDEDFIIDRHPDHPQVVFASACSGHGFKFSSAIGEVLAAMAQGGPTPSLISPFSAARFSMTGPGAPPL